MSDPEFDRLSRDYDELLRDPVREAFTGPDSGFFHARKRDLIRSYFRSVSRDTRTMDYLDVGCGRGELASLLRHDFRRVTGCDPSSAMLESAKGVETRIQDQSGGLPFASEEFDFVTAVCVYHHVPPQARTSLTVEVARVLRPGGVFAVIEHNPRNPVTRLIVARSAIDADAILLHSHETGELMRAAGFTLQGPLYFLWVPAPVFRFGGQRLERALRAVPLGGQYAVFGTKNRGVSD